MGKKILIAQNFRDNGASFHFWLYQMVRITTSKVLKCRIYMIRFWYNFSSDLASVCLELLSFQEIYCDHICFHEHHPSVIVGIESSAASVGN